MINQYIAEALRRAHYELLENGEGFFGSIPPLTGVWAQASTLEECREELKFALEAPIPHSWGHAVDSSESSLRCVRTGQNSRTIVSVTFTSRELV